MITIAAHARRHHHHHHHPKTGLHHIYMQLHGGHLLAGHTGQILAVAACAALVICLLIPSRRQRRTRGGSR